MINAVSLFANVGIGETYLDSLGINVCLANELLENRCKFHKHLFPCCDIVCGDITKKDVFNELIKASKDKRCELLLATPPCQGMSTAGKMDKNDYRNSLIMYAINFALELKPKYILFENVPQQKNTCLKYEGNELTIPEIINITLGNEYDIKYDILNAADYEVPQTRKRLFFIMTRKDLNLNWCFPKKCAKVFTVRDAIGDLPSFESIAKDNIPSIDYDFFYKNQYKTSKQIHKWHKPSKMANRYIIAMLNTPTGKSAYLNKTHFPKKLNGERMKGFLNTFKRMEWDKPAPTVTMQSGNIGSQENGHPGRPVKDGLYSDARVLSILEIMRLMSLPDDWNIPDWASDKLIRDVIGEGVPPLLMKAVLSTLAKEIN